MIPRMFKGPPCLPETYAREVERRRGPLRAGLRCLQLPLAGAEPGAGLSPEFLASLVLQRVHRGEVAKSGDHYSDRGCPMPSYLTEAFDELADGGLLALAEQDLWGPRRISLTDTGTARYVQLSAPPRPAVLRVPDPQFPTKTPAGRRSNRPVPAPGGQPDPTPLAGAASGEQLRWAHCPDDEHVPLPTDAAGSALAVLAVSQRGTASLVECASLPVRSPGTHLHSQLRRPPVAGGCGAGGRSG